MGTSSDDNVILEINENFDTRDKSIGAIRVNPWQKNHSPQITQIDTDGNEYGR